MKKNELILLICFLFCLSCSNAGDLHSAKDEDNKTEAIKEGDTDKTEQSESTVVDNLPDLPWLKDKIDEITLLFQQGNPLRIAIYQCIYGDEETGFLEDRGNVAFFYNCEGDILCIMGGVAGVTCSELNIVCRKLIWKIENGFINDSCEFDNPLTDLPWLKKTVEDFISYSDAVGKRHFQIHQCTYVEESIEKVGFIVTPVCVGIECLGFSRLYTCTGVSLCNMGGIFGDCEEFNIANINLIWEIN